jgi:ABC-type multidrug transport system ATPase subunit
VVAGFDVIKQLKEIRNAVGYMPGKFSLYQDLTVEENYIFSPLSSELQLRKIMI